MNSTTASATSLNSEIVAASSNTAAERPSFGAALTQGFQNIVDGVKDAGHHLSEVISNAREAMRIPEGKQGASFLAALQAVAPIGIPTAAVGAFALAPAPVRAQVTLSNGIVDANGNFDHAAMIAAKTGGSRQHSAFGAYPLTDPSAQNVAGGFSLKNATYRAGLNPDNSTFNVRQGLNTFSLGFYGEMTERSNGFSRTPVLTPEGYLNIGFFIGFDSKGNPVSQTGWQPHIFAGNLIMNVSNVTFTAKSAFTNLDTTFYYATYSGAFSSATSFNPDGLVANFSNGSDRMELATFFGTPELAVSKLGSAFPRRTSQVANGSAFEFKLNGGANPTAAPEPGTLQLLGAAALIAGGLIWKKSHASRE